METASSSSSSSSTQITDKYLNINMGNNSPSIKTPNLVARLMGLDLLPQTTSPKLEEILKNPSFKNVITTHLDKNIGVSGTVSLPETPRISASRRSDVEHHRLSLQLYEENFEEELKETPVFTIKTQRSEQNAKQVKVKVSRTFGSDLTNTINCKKDSNVSDFSGQIWKILNLPLKEPELESSKSYSLNESVKTNIQVQLQKQHKKSIESFDLRKPPQAFDDGVGSKREEAMVTNKANVLDKNMKKTSLLNDIVNNSLSANQQFHKQGQNHSSQAYHDLPLIKRTKQKQSNNSSTFLYNDHHQKVTPPTLHTFQENRQPNCTSNFINNSEQQHHYIQRILRRTVLSGEDNTHGAIYNTHFQSNKKIYDTNCSTCVKSICTKQKYPVSHSQCRKKLIFHLVDEILADLLVNLCVNLQRKGLNRDDQINRSDLVEKLCKKIESLPPSMNCQVLEDIDVLIYDDFRRLKVGNKRGAYEDEEIEECMVMDIGDYIVEELVHEMVLDVYD